MPTPLTLAALQSEAALWQSRRSEATLFGVTDGKAVGTHVEYAFQERLRRRYTFPAGNAARGIDFPGLDVDLKVTSVR